MNLEALSELGKVAGIAGIAVGALVIIFRSVINRRIFSNLSKEHSYSIMRMIVISASLIAVLGIVAWISIEPQSTDDVEKWVQGEVQDADGNPIAGVNVELANRSAISDNSGRFYIKLRGQGERVYSLSVNDSKFQYYTQNLPINFGEEGRLTLPDPLKLIWKEKRDPQPVPKNDDDDPPPVVNAGGSTAYLKYMGDNNNCVLNISVNIGGKNYAPTSNSFALADVPVGYQDYVISGMITCNVGTCTAEGRGSLEIRAGASYYVVWENTNYGYCEVYLATQEELQAYSQEYAY